MRSKAFLLFLVLFLSCTASLVMSMLGSSDEEPPSLLSRPKAKVRVGGVKEMHSLGHSELEEVYVRATRAAHEAEPSFKAVQLVDQFGNFLTFPRTEGTGILEREEEIRRSKEAMMDLVTAVKGLHPRKYFVVAIFGHQSTGKSHLLNAVFGTKFAEKGEVMDQMTRGVWLARSPVMDDLLVVDCEGSGGAESLSQRGREAVISEFGMLYAMLVSQLVIFNLNVAHLNERQQTVMFTNIVSYYMNNRIKGSPPLRIIITVRDVTSRVKLVNLEKYAREIIERAYGDNTHRGEGSLESFFDVHFFWFGNFDYTTDENPRALGYTDEFVEDSEIGKVAPYFIHRLKLFKARFTNRESDRCYLKDLRYAVEAPQLPCFLHEFWNTVNSQEGVGLENVLELTVKTRLAKMVEALCTEFDRSFEVFIRENSRNAPEAVIGPLDALYQGTLERSLEALERSAPTYGRGLVREYKEQLAKMFAEIGTKHIPRLLMAMAEAMAPSVTEAAEVDLQADTHAKELEALARFESAIARIQKLDTPCERRLWARPLEQAKSQMESRIQTQQRVRVQRVIVQRIGEVNRGDGDFIRGVNDLANDLHRIEGLPVVGLQTDIATVFYASLKPGHRKQKVLDVFEHHYANDHQHRDVAKQRAEGMRDQLVAFRTHFNDRVAFAHSAQDWGERMSDDLEHHLRGKDHAHQQRVQSQNELRRLQAQVEANNRESSIKWALAAIMCYNIMTDFSILQVIVYTIIFILAISGMMGPQLLEPNNLVAIPGLFVSFFMRLFSLASFGARWAGIGMDRRIKNE